MSRDRGAWWAAVYGAAQSRTRLKWLSGSSSSSIHIFGLPRWLRWKRILLQCSRLWFDPWVRKFPWRRDGLPTSGFLDFPGGTDGREYACNAGDQGSVPGLGRTDPLEESMVPHSNTLSWGIPTDRGAWGAAVLWVAESESEWLSIVETFWLSQLWNPGHKAQQYC